MNRDTSFDFVPELQVSGKIFSFSMLTCGYLLLSAYCAVLISYLTVETVFMPFKGPYLNDVYTIFGILDPLPPLSAFWPDL